MRGLLYDLVRSGLKSTSRAFSIDDRSVFSFSLISVSTRALIFLGICSDADVSLVLESDKSGKLPVLETATAITAAFAICKAATFITSLFGIQGWNLPAITAMIVILATTFPRLLGFLVEPGEAMALILMQVIYNMITF